MCYVKPALVAVLSVVLMLSVAETPAFAGKPGRPPAVTLASGTLSSVSMRSKAKGFWTVVASPPQIEGQAWTVDALVSFINLSNGGYYLTFFAPDGSVVAGTAFAGGQRCGAAVTLGSCDDPGSYVLPFNVIRVYVDTSLGPVLVLEWK